VKPETVHRICQELRNWRAELTAEERFARSQPESETKRELFAIVNFWRKHLNDVERSISQSGSSAVK
jgi:hypothetical protein